MFRLSLIPANQVDVKRWLILAGLTAGTSTLSVAAVASRLRDLFPQLLLEQFIYIALAIAFVTGLPLLVFPRVLSVSLAELGVASSLVYLAYSFIGVFKGEYQIILTTLIVVIALILVVLFYSGVTFARKEKSRSDAILGVVLLLVFLCVWLYPLLVIWS